MRPRAFLGRGEVRLGRTVRIEPGAVHAADGAVVAGDGGDKGGAAEDRGAFAVAELGMEAERREPAAGEAAGPEIGFRVSAVHRAA